MVLSIFPHRFNNTPIEMLVTSARKQSHQHSRIANSLGTLRFFQKLINRKKLPKNLNVIFLNSYSHITFLWSSRYSIPPSHLLSNENGGMRQSNVYLSSRSIRNVPLKFEQNDVIHSNKEFYNKNQLSEEPTTYDHSALVNSHDCCIEMLVALLTR